MSFSLDSLSGNISDRDSGTLESGLTRPQRRVLDGLKLAIQRYRGAPSLKEIAECCGRDQDGAFYPPGIHLYLRQLAELGYVELGKPGEARAVRLLKEE